ncbi:MAG: hypothetical protein ACTSO4_16205 [Promethearchaeota archaeon]
MVTLIIGIYIGNKIVKSLDNLIGSYKNIFYTEEKYKEYINYLYRTYKSKIELYLPLILGIIYGVFQFMNNYNNLINGYNIGFYIENDFLKILNVINNLFFTAWYTVSIIIIFSIIINLINAFRCLNKLGSKNFPLKVSYEDLELGAFNSIGKYVISITIPSLILSTFFSILGLYILLIFKDIVIGYFYMITSLLLTAILSFLLYKNTIHIHEAIVKYKEDLKADLINEIRRIHQFNNEEMPVNVKYDTIYKIYDYYDRVKSISDWPFDPTSVKKFLATFSSSILPFILSFFGIA